MTTSPSAEQGRGKYASVNGIEMYYELHGAGRPLVLVHGGGSTITTTFGRVLPLLARNHTVIAVEMQAHGHTSDRNAPESFAQDAADIAELLRQLNVERADIFGFSNGGHTALELGIRHPDSVRKLIIASAFYKRDGVPAGFWEGMERAQFSNMPQVYKDEFLKLNNDAAALRNMFDKDVERMRTFKDWKDEEIRSIEAPALVVIGDRDLPTPEHAVEMYRLMARARLAILPGAHGSFMGEAMSAEVDSKAMESFVGMVEEFLAEEAANSKQ